MKTLTKINPDFTFTFKNIDDEELDRSSLYYVSLYYLTSNVKDDDIFKPPTTSNSLGISTFNTAVQNLNILKDHVTFYSNIEGKYLCFLNNIPQKILTSYLKTKEHKGNGKFPYSSIEKGYAAQPLLTKFMNSSNSKLQRGNNILPYSFGLEFETSKGYIPEELCYKQGLIPLYDGSISGIEYTTVPLRGNIGIELLKQQLETLTTYTEFDKECALHIHFGNVPVNKYFAYILYIVSYYLQAELEGLYIPLAFQTEQYKKSKKSYCKFIPNVGNIEQFCYHISDGAMKNLDNYTQSHPSDRDGGHKWQIKSRYYWINLVNLLYYKKNKTVEFRFLRPTYHPTQIINWIYIFSAILTYTTQIYDKFLNINLTPEKLQENSNEVNIILNSLLRSTLVKDTKNDNFLKTIIKHVYNIQNPTIEVVLLQFLEELKTQRDMCILEGDLCGEYTFLKETSIFTASIN